MRADGYPAYTTSTGWLGYPDEKVRRLCRDGVAAGWRYFKIKVGVDLAADIRRVGIVREEIGDDRVLMVDANQAWDVDQAIDWMQALAPARPWWIEEPTSPDDILGHARIATALAPLGIRVATGEHGHNRVMFKQFLQADAIGFCQIDSCRLGGVNEVLAVLLHGRQVRRPGLSPRGRRRALRVCPAPRDLRLHRRQRLARGPGRGIRRSPARALRGAGDRPRRPVRRPRRRPATASRCIRSRWRATRSPTATAWTLTTRVGAGAMSGRLADKVCLITGAGSGIGRASALAVRGRGRSVAVADIDARRGRRDRAR